MKIVTIVGARPQFVKAAAVSRVIRQYPSEQLKEILVHTGQHFDDNMSKVFFDDLDIPTPEYSLNIGGGTHGEMTGRMLESVEKVLVSEKPDWVLIYGDTNSTLAGALAAAKLHIPVAHVEAGLRSFNMKMPEEINRILADRISTLLFCPTVTAVQNLQAEGVSGEILQVGDVMYDVALYYRDRAKKNSQILSTLNLQPGKFALATCHRAENTDDPQRFSEILQGLAHIASERPVVLPLHPRARNLIQSAGWSTMLDPFIVTEPLPFLDMVALEQAAAVILTDSGGVQKEAFFYGVPCITLRDETEWVETVQLGWNRLVGANRQKMIAALAEIGNGARREFPYGDGKASEKIVAQLLGISPSVAPTSADEDRQSCVV